MAVIGAYFLAGELAEADDTTKWASKTGGPHKRASRVSLVDSDLREKAVVEPFVRRGHES